MGGGLEGGVGPSLYDAKEKYNEEEIVNIILNGKGSMPGGLVSQSEARNIARFIMSLEVSND